MNYDKVIDFVNSVFGSNGKLANMTIKEFGIDVYKMHECTECGTKSDNIRSTSLCCDCQIVELMNLLHDYEEGLR